MAWWDNLTEEDRSNPWQNIQGGSGSNGGSSGSSSGGQSPGPPSGASYTGSPHGPVLDAYTSRFGAPLAEGGAWANIPSNKIEQNLFGENADPQMLMELLTGANMAPGGDLDEQIAQFQQLLNSTLYAGGREALRLRDESDARHQQELGFLQEQFELANKPTFTDEDIDRMFGKAADQANLDAGKLMSNLRSHLGQSGVRGGTAAGVASQVELDRLGQLTGARRDLRIFKANADARDRIEQWKRSQYLGDVMGREPSPFFSDWLASVSQIRLAQEGLAREERAAENVADAQQQAGMMAMLGSIMGAI